MIEKILLLVFNFTVFVSFINCQNRNVNDFKYATWNTQGNKWSYIAQYMRDEHLDVMLVQEAGSVPPAATPLDPTQHLPLSYIRFTPEASFDDDLAPIDFTALFLLEYVWQPTTNQLLYIYHYDNTVRETRITESKKQIRERQKAREKGEPQPSFTKGAIDERSTQSMAIVSTYRGSRTFLLPMIDSSGALSHDRNARPVIGLQIENAVFFDFHARSTRSENEANPVINIISNFFASNRSTLTWTVAGDFNRRPDTVSLPRIRNYFTAIIRSRVDTHQVVQDGSVRSTDELDFSVIGGPTNSIDTISATLMRIILQNFISDHGCVIFTPNRPVG